MLHSMFLRLIAFTFSLQTAVSYMGTFCSCFNLFLTKFVSQLFEIIAFVMLPFDIKVFAFDILTSTFISRIAVFLFCALFDGGYQEILGPKRGYFKSHFR